MPPATPDPLSVDGDGLRFTDVPGARPGALGRASLSPSEQVLEVRGDVDAPEAADLVAAGVAVVDDGADLVVDLRAVTFLGSRGISALLRVHRHAGAAGRRMRVIVDRGSHVVMRPLTLTQVDTTLDLVDSLDTRD
ncbi:STAS domain-containing protein [Pseudonocardia sp.]|uniref:STAS domain-containing protein n=1 Tax=Pseudonocardia sp. TaxID=60912 RepID=UPI003D0C4EC2